MRESVPRQVDEKSGVPKEEKGVWGPQSGDKGLEFSRRRKGQASFFFSTFLSLRRIKGFFFLFMEFFRQEFCSGSSHRQGIFPTQVSCISGGFFLF